MIPAPLTVAVDVRPRSGIGRARLLRWCGVVALVLAVGGAVVWVAGYSALGYQRFDVFDAGRSLSFRQGGRYTVFEEFDGASQEQLPSPIEVLVTDDEGDPVAVEPTHPPGVRAAPDAYRTPWHEGRSLGTFELDEGGTYLVEVGFLPGEAGRYRPFQQVTLAVGRQPTLSWMAGWAGLALLAGVPAGIGVGCLLASRRTVGRRAADG